MPECRLFDFLVKPYSFNPNFFLSYCTTPLGSFYLLESVGFIVCSFNCSRFTFLTDIHLIQVSTIWKSIISTDFTLKLLRYMITI